MMTTRPPLLDGSYIKVRARLLKTRWEMRLSRPLEIQTQRLMPGPGGENYYADVVLQDPVSGLPLVVFEIKGPSKSAEQAQENLRRILDTRHFVELLGGKRPKVVLVVAPTDKTDGRRILESVGRSQVQLEVV